jgi:hypothetical protein
MKKRLVVKVKAELPQRLRGAGKMDIRVELS